MPIANGSPQLKVTSKKQPIPLALGGCFFDVYVPLESA